MDSLLYMRERELDSMGYARREKLERGCTGRGWGKTEGRSPSTTAAGFGMWPCALKC